MSALLLLVSLKVSASRIFLNRSLISRKQQKEGHGTRSRVNRGGDSKHLRLGNVRVVVFVSSALRSCRTDPVASRFSLRLSLLLQPSDRNRGKMQPSKKAVMCAAMCFCGSALSGVDAFAPVALMTGASRHSGLVLRQGVTPAHGMRKLTKAGSGSRITVGMAKTQLVTYGDMWRDALHENENGEQMKELPMTDATSAEGDDFTYATEELSTFASEVVAPIKAAATGVAFAVWNRLSSSPDDDEIQRNLKAFAQSHRGAVMTPLGDEELASEVRYLGMFPDLVDALLEAQEIANTKEKEQEDVVALAAAALKVGTDLKSTDA